MHPTNASFDPPRTAARLLDWAVEVNLVHVGLAGDLHEQFVRRRQIHGRTRCGVWYWRQVVTAALLHLALRLRPERGHRPPAHQPKAHVMAHLARDIRYALRMLRKAPGVTMAAVFALSLGIGLPTIMFTIVNGVLRDLPVEEGERIFHLYRTDLREGGQISAVSHHDFAEWREQFTSFDGIGGFATEDVTLSGSDARPLRRNAAFVTPGTFEVLRVQPALGRSFHPSEGTQGSESVVIISDAVWRHRFAGRADVLGRTLAVDGTETTIVGVMPENFRFPLSEDLWLPLQLRVDGAREDGPYLEVMGRLKHGVSHSEARAEMQTVAARIAAEYPQVSGERGADLMGYTDSQMGPELARGLYTMLGAVSFVLLIACANVANLLLARAVVRGREIAVRTALGAGRGRVLTQLMVEAFVVASIGGVLGVGIALLGVHLFDQAMAPFIGVAWIDIRIDPTVLAFVASVVVMAGAFAGTLPALQASGTNVGDILKDESRGTSSLRLGRFSRGLVVGEIALSCALLVVSGLMIKGVLKLRATDLGMPVAEIVTGEVELPRQVYTTPADRVRFFEELERRLATIPGVESVAMMSDVPGTGGFQTPVAMDGNADDRQAELPRVNVLRVSPAFLDVLGTGVVEGRGFTVQDRAGAEPVALVNQAFAQRFSPGRPAIGRTVQFGRGASADRYTIVGITPDLYMGGIDEIDANGPGVYIAVAQAPHVSMQAMVRAVGDPLALTSAIQEQLAALDPTLALANVDRVDHIIANGVLVFEVFGKLFMFFGITALFLASVGLYGVMSFMVGQRTREWGLRMALGADMGRVIRLVLKRGVAQLAAGLAIGLVLAGAISVPLSDIFYQVEPWDRWVFAAVALILTATGLLATVIPARRATRVDPLRALRHE